MKKILNNYLSLLYIIVFGLICNLFSIPEIIKVLLAIPAFLIIPIELGDFFWKVIIKIFKQKKFFEKSNFVSQKILHWLTGSTILPLLGILMFKFNIFNIYLYVFIVLLILILNCFIYNNKNGYSIIFRRIKSDKNFLILGIIIINSLLPILYVKSFSPFPLQIGGDSFAHASIGMSIVHNWLPSNIMDNGVYLPLISFFYATTKIIFNWMNPLSLSWVLPFLFYLLYGLGFYLFIFSFSRNKKIALIGSVLAVWFCGEGLLANMYRVTPQNVFYLALPYILYLTKKISEQFKFSPQKYFNIKLIIPFLFPAIIFCKQIIFRSPLSYFQITIFFIAIICIIYLINLYNKNFFKNNYLFFILGILSLSVLFLHFLIGGVLNILIYISIILVYYFPSRQKEYKKLIVLLILTIFTIVEYLIFKFSGDIGWFKNIIQQLVFTSSHNFTFVQKKLYLESFALMPPLLLSLGGLIICLFQLFKKRIVRNDYSFVIFILLLITICIYWLPVPFAHRLLNILLPLVAFAIGYFIYNLLIIIKYPKYVKLLLVGLLIIFIYPRLVYIYQHRFDYDREHYYQYIPYNSNVLFSDIKMADFINHNIKKDNVLFITDAYTYRMTTAQTGKILHQDAYIQGNVYSLSLKTKGITKNFKILVNGGVLSKTIIPADITKTQKIDQLFFPTRITNNKQVKITFIDKNYFEIKEMLIKTKKGRMVINSNKILKSSIESDKFSIEISWPENEYEVSNLLVSLPEITQYKRDIIGSKDFKSIQDKIKTIANLYQKSLLLQPQKNKFYQEPIELYVFINSVTSNWVRAKNVDNVFSWRFPSRFVPFSGLDKFFNESQYSELIKQFDDEIYLFKIKFL